jgi:predicted dehydrogenase
LQTTIKWGVLGVAAIATGRIIPALLQSPYATLLALASRDAERARNAAKGVGVPRAYAGYDRLLADPEIDAVYIPLPNHMHFEWSVRALEAGKHVLCEKPLCLTVDQVAKLCAVRDSAKRHIEEGFAYRNHPQWAKVDELLANNSIGPVRAANGTLAKQFYDPADIRNNPVAGGGALYDLGAYAISACNLVFKRTAKRVVAAIDMDPRFRIDRLSTALLDYGDAHATFTVGTQAGSSSWGTHQQLTVLGGSGWLRFNFPYAHARPSACFVQFGDASTVGSLPTSTFYFEPMNHYALEVDRFSRLLLGHDVPSWPIEDAVRTLRTIEALFESGRTGTWQLLTNEISTAD